MYHRGPTAVLSVTDATEEIPLLDRHLYGRLLDGLVARYPGYDELALFLERQLGRALAVISAPDALPHVARRVVSAARAQGWLAELVTAAADESPHIAELQEVRAAFPIPPPAAPAPALRLALLLPPRLGDLAEAVRADRRVAVTGAAGADALVVGTDVTAPPGFGVPSAPPVALVHHPAAAPATGVPLASSLAASVVQIVVAGEPRDTARRVVDHLSAVVGVRR